MSIFGILTTKLEPTQPTQETHGPSHETHAKSHDFQSVTLARKWQPYPSLFFKNVIQTQICLVIALDPPADHNGAPKKKNWEIENRSEKHAEAPRGNVQTKK